jgi:hypothetical protein
MAKRQPITDSKKIEEQVRRFLDENPDLKMSLKIFSISEQEYANAMEAQNQKEQLTYTNSTGEASDGYLRANSK